MLEYFIMQVDTGILIQIGQYAAKFGTLHNILHKRNADLHQWIGGAGNIIQHCNFRAEGVIARSPT